MPTLIKNKWYPGDIIKIENFTSKTKAVFIRFTIQVTTTDNTIYATSICKPILVPGGPLYKWLRVCDIRLSDVDETLKPSMFIGKSVKVKIKQNGSYFNVDAFKHTGG